MTGRVVLIVGATSGIGLATAQRLAGNGDRLALMARDADSLTAVAEQCRARGSTHVATYPGDVGVESDVNTIVAAVTSQFGRLDVVVHTATVMAYGTVEEMPSEVFLEVVGTAVHGTLFLAKAVLPVLRRQQAGTLIIVNSLLGSVTVPNMGAYATSKWGQRAIARTLQQEVRRERNVHVCIVSPGSTNTPIYYQAANYTGKQARPPIPVLQPERVAAAIARLADHPRKHVSVPVGPPNPIIITGYRLLPFIYDLFVGPLFKLFALTRTDQPATTGNVHHPVAGLERRHGHWPDK